MPLKLNKFRFVMFILLILPFLFGQISTAQNTIVRIHEVQGAPDHPDYPDSPFEDLEDVTIEGVVVGDFQDGAEGINGDINGFYVQEETAHMDENPQTSEGIYVFERRGTIINVDIGDVVQVTGKVDEIRNLTQIQATQVSIISSNNPLPEPTVVTLPLTDLTEWEYTENMLVSVRDDDALLTVNDNYDLGRYGTIQLTANGRAYQYTQLFAPSDAATFEAYRQEVGLSLILIDDGRTNENAVILPQFNGEDFSAQNSIRSGMLVEQVTGILEFRFDEWRVHPTEPIIVTTAENERPQDPSVGGSLTVASVNLLNYFNGNGLGEAFPTPRGADTFEEFQRQRSKTLEALALLDADIIGLNELENDYFAGELSAAQDLVNGLNEMPEATSCGANWAYIDVAAEPLNFGELGTDAIAVGFLYCAATVTVAPDTVPAVLTDEQLPQLGLDDLVPTFNGVNTNRVPLAVTFREIATDEVLTIVVNHLKAKGGEGDGGDDNIGNGVAGWNERRRNAITALDAWLATNPTGTTDPDILMIGDFNSYAMEDPIQDMIALGYANLNDRFAHSYGFPLALGESPETQGWGTLDYVFANETLQAQVTGSQVVHINADEPVYIDYNIEFKPEEIADAMYTPDAYRASDHDPIIVGLDLTLSMP